MASSYKSKYYEVFEALRERHSADFKLHGEAVLVEVLPKKELKTKGGLIIGAAADTHRATSEDFRRALGLVLYIGAAVSERTVTPGNVVLMPYNPMYLSEFPGIQEYTQNGLALINESDVLVKFDSIRALEQIETTVTEVITKC